MKNDYFRPITDSENVSMLFQTPNWSNNNHAFYERKFLTKIPRMIFLVSNIEVAASSELWAYTGSYWGRIFSKRSVKLSPR